MTSPHSDISDTRTSADFDYISGELYWERWYTKEASEEETQDPYERLEGKRIG